MKKWPWKLYGILFTGIVFLNLWDIYSKDSSFLMYYTMLMAFNKRYCLLFILNVLSIIINLISLLVVFFYAFDIKSSLKFWRIFFLIRVGFDLAGHFYDSQFIKAAFFQSFSYGLACIGAFVLPMLPSYMAHYIYAFKKPVNQH